MAEEQPLPAIYVNAVKFVTTPYDISLAIGLTDPPFNLETEDGPTQVGVRAYGRVVMSPMYFKKFITVASDVLKKYEEKNGTIPTAKK